MPRICHQMKKADKEELDSLFSQFVKLYKNRCFLCRERYRTDEAWTMHHAGDRKRNLPAYRPGEKIYSDFKLPNGRPDKLSYYRYLTPVILSEPSRFRLLHSKHHWLAENTARLSPDNFKRLVVLVNEIHHERPNGKRIT